MKTINETLERIIEFLKAEAKTETIVGEQFQLGEFTCVPVISIGIGFGGGSGEGKGTPQKESEGGGSGGGAGMGIKPVGFLVTKAGQIQFIPTQSMSGLGAAFEKIPGLIEKYMETKKHKEMSEV